MVYFVLDDIYNALFTDPSRDPLRSYVAGALWLLSEVDKGKLVDGSFSSPLFTTNRFTLSNPSESTSGFFRFFPLAK